MIQQQLSEPGQKSQDRWNYVKSKYSGRSHAFLMGCVQHLDGIRRQAIDRELRHMGNRQQRKEWKQGWDAWT